MAVCSGIPACQGVDTGLLFRSYRLEQWHRLAIVYAGVGDVFRVSQTGIVKKVHLSS